MQIDLLDVDSPRWPETLASIPHDVFQLPEYLRFAAQWQEPGEPSAFLAEEDGRYLLVPLIIRRIETTLGASARGLFDATCPRDYPGPLLRLGPEGDGDGFVTRAIDAFVAALRQRRVVAAFVRLHPLFELPKDELRRVGCIVQHQETVSVDLALSYAELWQQTRHNHRRDINRAHRQGYVARIDESWDSFDAFVQIHDETMQRLNAAAFWHLSRDYFLDLRHVLGDRLHLMVAEIGGEVAAAMLVTEVDGTVECLVCGTRAEFHVHSPMKLLNDFVRQWAKERGNHTLHLGGSASAGDSLFNFKLGFSPNRHPVITWRVVTDAPFYQALVAGWEKRHGMTADGLDGFFPAYRRDAYPGSCRMEMRTCALSS